MLTQHNISEELLNIYPELKEATGYIFFGTMVDEPPYESGTYQSWRLNIHDTPDSAQRRKAVGYFLDSLVENVLSPSPKPHGFVKISNAIITLHWTSCDIADTMLNNIDTVSQLNKYSFLNLTD